MPFEMQTTSQTPMRAMQKRIRRLGFVTNHAIKKTIGFIKKTMGFISLISFFFKNQIASLGFLGFASPARSTNSIDVSHR
jgi:hypothetical protein